MINNPSILAGERLQPPLLQAAASCLWPLSCFAVARSQCQVYSPVGQLLNIPASPLLLDLAQTGL